MHGWIAAIGCLTLLMGTLTVAAEPLPVPAPAPVPDGLSVRSAEDRDDSRDSVEHLLKGVDAALAVTKTAALALHWGAPRAALAWSREPLRRAAGVMPDGTPIATRGHGPAIAQVHGHLILPLCNERDRKTQVRWGARDFELRFGRRPKGMWLAETAVDHASLEALVDEGIA